MENNEKTIHRMLPRPAALPRRQRVAAYCRVSNGKDAMLHSMSAQISYYSDMIQKHPGWEYVGVYADEAYTGTKDSRPQFMKMIEDCRAGKIDRIITKAISRFARNTVTLLETVRELKRLGVAVYFEEQRIDSMSGDGELMLTILASFAQEESKSVSDNCKWRIRKDFAEGKGMNLMLLYGYRDNHGVIEIDPEEAVIVRRVFEEYVAGKGCDQIAEELQAEGVPCRLGGQWRGNYVRKMLKNEKYAGDSLLQKTYRENHLTKKKMVNRGEYQKYYVEGTHPAIIDHETYDQVQRMIAENWTKANIKKPTYARYPFTGMIICGNCGAHYQRRTTRIQFLWSCTTYFRKGKRYCPAKQVPEEVLFRLTREVLDIDEITDENLKPLEKIVIPGPNQVRFMFLNGRVEDRTWEDLNRSELWTDEMRQAARERVTRRYANERNSQNRS